MKAYLLVLSLAVVGLASPPPAASQRLYTITDLGTLGGLISSADDINNVGQVVGTANSVIGGGNRAFLWEGGVMTNLGTLGGPTATSGAKSINNAGQVVGVSDTASGAFHAFLWRDGAMTDLGTLPGGSESLASDINDAGQVVGSSETLVGGDFQDHAVLWSGGETIDLGTLGGRHSLAEGINNSGQVVGASSTAAGEWHAFLWQDGVMTDLGTPGSRSSGASAINNLGQILGSSEWGPFILEKGVMTILSSVIPPGSGWVLREARAINDAGQIVGWGKHNGQTRAFLLTPAGSIVNSTGDVSDSDTTDGVCDTGILTPQGKPECTLRAAIEQANYNAGNDTIIFNIPYTDLGFNDTDETFIIRPASALPTIVGPFTIDATTQFDGVVLDGTLAGAGANGLTFMSGDNVVKGLVIKKFGGHGVFSEAIGDLRADTVELVGNSGDGVRALLASVRLREAKVNNNQGSGVVGRDITIEGKGNEFNDNGRAGLNSGAGPVDARHGVIQVLRNSSYGIWAQSPEGSVKINFVVDFPAFGGEVSRISDNGKAGIRADGVVVKGAHLEVIGNNGDGINVNGDANLGNVQVLINEGAGVRAQGDVTIVSGKVCGNKGGDIFARGVLNLQNVTCPTPVGNNVAVAPVNNATGSAPAALTFATVTQDGSTAVTISNSGAPPPLGFRLGNPPTYFDLTTTALFSGAVKVCINYSGISFTSTSALKLFHFEGGAWVDHTVSLNTVSKVICATVTSLSPFAIFEPENLPPVANAGGPYTVNEGGSVLLTGSGNDPDVGDTLTYAWDLNGDSVFETPGQIVTFSAASLDGPSTKTAVLKVCDSFGACATSQATINILNVAPTLVSVSNNGPVNEGSPVTVTASATDPGPDTLTYLFDFNNDGTFEVPQASSSATHIYPDNGMFTVRVQVQDDDGGLSGVMTTVVQVNNVPPTISVPVDTTVDEGKTLTLNIGASDVGVLDVVTLAASGLPPGASFSQTSGNPATGILSWTPAYTQAGS